MTRLRSGLLACILLGASVLAWIPTGFATAPPSSCTGVSDPSQVFGNAEASCAFSCSPGQFVIVETTSAEVGTEVLGRGSCGSVDAFCLGTDLASSCKGIGGITQFSDDFGTCYGRSDEIFTSLLTVRCFVTTDEALSCSLGLCVHLPVPTTLIGTTGIVICTQTHTAIAIEVDVGCQLPCVVGSLDITVTTTSIPYWTTQTATGWWSCDGSVTRCESTAATSATCSATSEVNGAQLTECRGRGSGSVEAWRTVTVTCTLNAIVCVPLVERLVARACVKVCVAPEVPDGNGGCTRLCPVGQVPNADGSCESPEDTCTACSAVLGPAIDALRRGHSIVIGQPIAGLPVDAPEIPCTPRPPFPGLPKTCP